MEKNKKKKFRSFLINFDKQYDVIFVLKQCNIKTTFKIEDVDGYKISEVLANKEDYFSGMTNPVFTKPHQMTRFVKIIEKKLNLED